MRVQLPNCILHDRAFAQERAPSLLSLGPVSFSFPQESGSDASSRRCGASFPQQNLSEVFWPYRPPRQAFGPASGTQSIATFSRFLRRAGFSMETFTGDRPRSDHRAGSGRSRHHAMGYSGQHQCQTLAYDPLGGGPNGLLPVAVLAIHPGRRMADPDCGCAAHELPR
jgi:hypothetical protein